MVDCSCYHDEKNFLGKRGVCWGTKEREACSCGGDASKCDFYPEKRKLKKKTHFDVMNLKVPEDLVRPEWRASFDPSLAYESPIRLLSTPVEIERIKDEQDKLILRACEKVGVVVDKDELVKALAYDRSEYERGLRAGMAIAENEIRQLHEVIKDLDVKIRRLLHKEEE